MGGVRQLWRAQTGCYKHQALPGLGNAEVTAVQYAPLNLESLFY